MEWSEMTAMAIFPIAALSIASAVQAAPVQPNWQWLFDEETTSTTALDTGAAGDQKNATIIGAAGDYRSSTITPFSYAGNQSFIPGAGRLAQAPLNINVGTATTISVWLRLDTSYAERSNSWVFEATSATSGRTLLYYTRDTATSAPLKVPPGDPVYWNNSNRGNPGGTITVPEDGVWRHVVIVREGDGVNVWEGDLGDPLTKVHTSTLPTGNNVASTFDTLYMGAHSSSNGNDHVFRGQMDELAIWNSALSDADVAWLHANSLGVIPEPASMGMLALGALGLAARRRRVK